MVHTIPLLGLLASGNITMARKKSSGLFETAVKSLLGFGTTVRYKKSWTGKRQKVVKHHDTGKTKTYTHGCGLFGNKTKTRTTKGWHTIEEGTVKGNTFFKGATEYAQKSDGTYVKRSYKPGIFRDHVYTSEDGICFSCDGSGNKNLRCKRCGGSGQFSLKERTCFSCNGTGLYRSSKCKKCKGSGVFKPAVIVPCNRCDGKGTFEVSCNRCGGTGKYKNTRRR